MALVTYASQGARARRLFWEVLRHPNIVALWRLNETTAGTAYDSCTRNNLTGTIVGTPTLGVSMTNGFRGITFDGTNDVINLGLASSLSFERTDAFSGICVLNPNVSAIGIITGKMNGITADGWLWGVLDTRAPFLNLQVTDTTNECLVVANAALTNGTAVMLGFSKAAGTGAASEVTLYKNGAADADTDTIDTLASGSIVNGFSATIGATIVFDTYLNGTLGFVAIFNAALPATDHKRFAFLSGYL